MPETVDLDARRAERHDEPRAVKFGGQEWEFPAKLPLPVVDLLTDGKLAAAVVELLGDDDNGDSIGQQLLDLGMDTEDLEFLFKQVYKQPVGKSRGSARR